MDAYRFFGRLMKIKALLTDKINDKFYYVYTHLDKLFEKGIFPLSAM